MRVIVAGSRSVTDYRLVEEAIRRSGFAVCEVASGTARGVDRLGEAWALRHGVPVRRFPADWARLGRRAGFERNLRMIEYARRAPEGGALVAVWDGVSAGTRHTIAAARRRGLKVFVLQTRVEPLCDDLAVCSRAGRPALGAWKFADYRLEVTIAPVSASAASATRLASAHPPARRADAPPPRSHI